MPLICRTWIPFEGTSLPTSLNYAFFVLILDKIILKFAEVSRLVARVASRYPWPMGILEIPIQDPDPRSWRSQNRSLQISHITVFSEFCRELLELVSESCLETGRGFSPKVGWCESKLGELLTLSVCRGACADRVRMRM